MKKFIGFALLFCCFFYLVSVQAADVKVAKINKPDIEIPSFAGYVPNAIVIKLDPSLVLQVNAERSAATGRLGLMNLDQLAEKYQAVAAIQKFPKAEKKVYQGRVIDLKGWFRIEFARDLAVEAVVREYKNMEGVIDAQPIGIHTVSGTPNDARFADQWHLNQANDNDVDAPEAWDIETGDSQIIVGIMDTGVRYFHKDLGGSNASYDTPGNANGNMWLNTDEIKDNGIDDDGNGYVDDWIGWDFVTGVTGWTGEDASTPDNDPRDFNGHGTHCAGNVGAINNNGYATCSPTGGWNNGSNAPTANGVKVMALRIGWSGRQFIWEVGYISMDFAASAFYYAANNGAKITSCSWGSSNSGGVGEAIDYFLASGGLIFKSAGNSNNENTDYMTARTDIISVAASNSSDCRASFSSYGTWVDITAPGEAIMSLYHDHNDPQNDYVASMDGTSMASPLAASVAALIWSKNPSWTASQVKQQLFDSAENIYGESCNSSFANKLGVGRVNAFNGVNTGGTPAPVAAFSGSPTSGCAALTVNFTDQSTGEISSWSWNFGDGATSTSQNPSHVYASAGNYTVALTVTGPGGADTETKTNFVVVSSTPTAQFVGTPLSGNAPLTVNFTDQSTGNPTTWSWNFGDGGSSSSQNPSYQYTSAGTYTVTLTVTNACGNDGETKTNYITVNACAAPVANFVGSPLSGNAPLTVNFTDQSTNNPTSWSWNFGDGGTSSSQNPSRQYTSAGTYTVSLTASNSCGSDGEVKTGYITVNAAPQNLMHIQAVDVTKETWSNVRYRGKARVKIVDANGNAVASATVNGAWSGGATDTDQVTTGSDGWCTAYSNWRRGNAEFTFCVNNVTKSGWTYDSNANVKTCGSTSGTTLIAVVTNIDISELEGDLSDLAAFNYPNPFNPTTNINFVLEKEGHVTVEIYNVLGEKVITLLDEFAKAGINTVTWHAKDDKGQSVGSGYYFYRITTENSIPVIRKMLLLK